MRHPTRLLFVLSLVVLAACVKPDPTPRFTPAWEKFDPTNLTGWLSTRKALLCSDCQFHNIYSKALPERNLSAEAAASTAIRPPQLDLFAPDVLRWILENGAPDKDVVLHLGDALNLSTTGEFHKFLDVMKSAGTPWFMAPGNHDGYYFGVYPTHAENLLADSAFMSGKPLGKDYFVRLYVAAIARQDESGCAELAAALGLDPRTDEDIEEVAKRVPLEFDWEAKEGATGLLARIAWKIDEDVPWHSYVIQAINMSGETYGERDGRVYLLDSCQYSRRPKMVPNAWRSYPAPINCGLTGQMMPDQLRKVRAWFEEGGEAKGGSMMCHHPFERLEPYTRSSVGYLWREYRVGLMVTAHTHAGYYAHHSLGGKRDEVELNIGSTTDWPMEWRTLQAFLKLDGDRAYVHAERKTLVGELRQLDGFFEDGWEIPQDAPDDYRSYKRGESAKGLLFAYYAGDHYTPYWIDRPGQRVNKAAVHTETQVKKTLLWTHHRLIGEFPTDPDKGAEWPRDCDTDAAVLKRIQTTLDQGDFETQIRLLVELGTFEDSRSSRDPKTGESSDGRRTRYKISQAAWASRFMAAKGRRLRLEDDLIRVETTRVSGVGK